MHICDSSQTLNQVQGDIVLPYCRHAELVSASKLQVIKSADRCAMNNRQYYVYLLTNRTNNVLYIGVTNNLERRAFEHRNKLVDGFTKKYNIAKLVFYEVVGDIESAIRREKQLKNWHREWKINLVNEFNPEWKDLSNDL